MDLDCLRRPSTSRCISLSRASGHTLQYWLGNREITLKQPSLPISLQNLEDDDRNVGQGPPWICTKCLAAVSAEQGTQVWARSEGRKSSTPWVINTWFKDYTLTSENPRNVRACLQFQHSGGWGRDITEFKARLSHVSQAHSPNREGLDRFISVVHCPSKLAQDPGFRAHCFRWHQDSRERYFFFFFKIWALREDILQLQPSTEKPLQFSCQFCWNWHGQKWMEWWQGAWEFRGEESIEGDFPTCFGCLYWSEARGTKAKRFGIWGIPP